jgi:hypothetical protein
LKEAIKNKSTDNNMQSTQELTPAVFMAPKLKTVHSDTETHIDWYGYYVRVRYGVETYNPHVDIDQLKLATAVHDNMMQIGMIQNVAVLSCTDGHKIEMMIYVQYPKRGSPKLSEQDIFDKQVTPSLPPISGVYTQIMAPGCDDRPEVRRMLHFNFVDGTQAYVPFPMVPVLCYRWSQAHSIRTTSTKTWHKIVEAYMKTPEALALTCEQQLQMVVKYNPSFKRTDFAQFVTSKIVLANKKEMYEKKKAELEAELDAIIALGESMGQMVLA